MVWVGQGEGQAQMLALGFALQWAIIAALVWLYLRERDRRIAAEYNAHQANGAHAALRFRLADERMLRVVRR